MGLFEMRQGLIADWEDRLLSAERSFCVYALIENGRYVYVGSTCCPSDRLRSHCVSDRFLGRLITMEELDWVPEDERFSTERLAIRLGLAYGYPLENRVWV